MFHNADLRKEYIKYFKENAQSYLHVKCSAYVYELFHIHIENNCEQSQPQIRGRLPVKHALISSSLLSLPDFLDHL